MKKILGAGKADLVEKRPFEVEARLSEVGELLFRAARGCSQSSGFSPGASALQFRRDVAQESKDLGEKKGSRWLAWFCLYESRLLVSGLGLAALAGQGLVEERYPRVTWYGPVLLLYFLWYLWADSPGSPSPENLSQYHSDAEIALLLWIACFFVLYGQRDHTWAVVTIALVSALATGIAVKSYYKSSAITLIGWMLAVPIVFRFAWPNRQRFTLVLVLGGVSIAIQGSVYFARALRTLRSMR